MKDTVMRWQSAVTRRELLCTAAVGTAALAAGGIGAYAQPASKPPNIIFILADDLGYADVSCYGRRDFTTPNIDRIAARGMRFLQGYANSAVCSASRLALITGRYQYRLRLGLEEPLSGNPEVGLPPEHPTLPSLLKKAGYGTTLIGKWHLGALPNFGPLKSGYDHFSTAAQNPRISRASRHRGFYHPRGVIWQKSAGPDWRRVPRNRTAPLVKVLAPSVPAAFPLRDALVARFCRRTSRRSTGTRTAATATRAASKAAPAPSALD